MDGESIGKSSASNFERLQQDRNIIGIGDLEIEVLSLPEEGFLVRQIELFVSGWAISCVSHMQLLFQGYVFQLSRPRGL
jgi:hypothetical protein